MLCIEESSQNCDNERLCKSVLFFLEKRETSCRDHRGMPNDASGRGVREPMQ